MSYKIKMKRGFLDRAKQSLPVVTAQPTTTKSSTTTDNNTSKNSSSSPTAKAVKSPSRKRGREEDNSTTDSSFYLKHQNAALATELKSLRFEYNEVEQERNVRRKQCKLIFQSIASLHAALCQAEDSSFSMDYTVTTDPPSTGNFDNVEFTQGLQNAIVALSNSESDDGTAIAEGFIRRLQNLHGKVISNNSHSVADLTARIAELETQVAEISSSRQDIHTRERKMRRNIYRMENEILRPEQLVKSVEDDAELEAEIQLEKTKLQERTSATVPSNGTAASAASTAQVQEYEDKIKQLQEATTAAEASFGGLNVEITARDERITELAKLQITEEQKAQLEELSVYREKLKGTEESFRAVKDQLVRRESQVGTAIANEASIKAQLDEQVQKFNKRWESMEQTDDQNTAELQYKLDQAIQSVRQSETARENLQTALAMNQTLTAKLDELKEKYNMAKNHVAKIQQEAKEAATTAAAKPSIENAESSPTTNAEPRPEKLQRDYRRARKELAAAKESKEIAKAKFERSERERESLMETNVKLMKQIGEKDEVNAKSLSTILQLKKLTEKLEEERVVLEQQAKSASQLALAARLATNAKVRVAEEVETANAELTARIAELEESLNATQSRLDEKVAECNVPSADSGKDAEIQNLQARCGELSKESEKSRAEIARLVTAVNSAERKLKETAKQDAPDGYAKNLKTQIKQLQSRIACPVCQDREKSCIIKSCRHMHCKVCVEERISSRNRKCPTCGVKFSENEVGDVWF